MAQMNTFIPPVFSLVALVGNLLSFAVYSRSSFVGQSASFYFRVMAITDTIFVLNWPELFEYTFNYVLFTRYSLACKILIYFLYSLPSISNWILTVVSLDRMLTIIFKNRAAILAQRKTQIAILFFIFVYNLGIYSPMLIFFDIINDANYVMCYSTDSQFSAVLGWFDIINSTLTPFVLMLISSIVIVMKLINSKHHAMGHNNMKANNSAAGSISNVQFIQSSKRAC